MKLNIEICCSPIVVEDKIRELKQFTQELKNSHKGIKVKISESYRFLGPSILKLCVIDLECQYPKVVGLLIGDRVFQFYIRNIKHQYEFMFIFAEVLLILKDFYFFFWSDWEENVIKSLSTSIKQQRGLAEHFLDNLNLFNIQQLSYESLVSGLLKIGEKVPEELLLRNARRSDDLFRMGYIDAILEHNYNCCVACYLVLKKRWLRLNLL